MGSNTSTSDWIQDCEIKSLLVRERYYRDTAQWQKLRESYHPDASKTSINITWFKGGIDGFVSGSKQMTTGGTPSTHNILPVEIHRQGDKAVSESTGSIMARVKYNNVDYDLISYAKFISRLERVDGVWKMLSLEAIYERDTLQPVYPGTGERIVAIEEHGRASYRCLSWLLLQKGFTVDQELPGSDIKGSTEKLLNDCFAWLRT
ncbi:unnamed protein product [Clonostachys rosea]|uniref:SnoaL-like domain-containing protein n=1 Tax=Bionectria ochroleuca TaxID=29856 RepID=A0ABY6U082_BIOOC|nr:unnamed protein product [Clonostachys rosea]